MLGSGREDARERRPRSLDGGVISLSSLQAQKPLSMVALGYLELLQVHMKAVQFVSRRRKPQIHASRDKCAQLKGDCLPNRAGVGCSEVQIATAGDASQNGL